MNSQELQDILEETCMRVVSALVNKDTENFDLVKADMQMLRDDVIPKCTDHENPDVKELALMLNDQMGMFGL